MKLPRDLSGERVASGLCRRWEYKQVHQAGSHIILETEIPSHQRLAIPAHKNLKIGTLGSILRVVGAHKGMSRDEILQSLL